MKKSFRKRALEHLRRCSGAGRYARDKRILRELESLIRDRKSKQVLLYIPLPMEADLRPLIRQLRRQGVTVLVPFMEGESFRLVKYRLPLRKRRFGIYEPKFSRQHRNKRIDLAIVPIVGTDPSFRRVGFGKGMYDRFFAREMKNIQETVFVQRDLCWSPRVVTDEYDVRGDLIVAGKGTVIR